MCRDAAVDHDRQRREILLEPVDVIIFERWNLAIFLWRKSLQDRVAHGLNAIRDQRRISHEASAEAACLHALRRAADLEIDFDTIVRQYNEDERPASVAARARELP
jgi:hypothetical protein